jgi:hypothetical protein
MGNGGITDTGNFLCRRGGNVGRRCDSQAFFNMQLPGFSVL